MKKDNLFLNFNDNENPISFDLNQNIVFYGSNGKGKTRILKTIHTIYELAKKNNLSNISKLIDEMNLKELKINNISYHELLTTNEEFKNKELTKVNEYLRINIEQYEYLFNLLKDVDINIHSINRKEFLNFLERFTKQIKINNTDGFDRWMKHLELVTKKLNNEQIFWTPEKYQEDSQKFEEIRRLVSFLTHQYTTIAYNKVDGTYLNTMREKSEEILNSLSLKSAYYISTDLIDIETIKKNILVRTEDLNKKFHSIFWEDKIKIEEIERFSELISMRKKLENDLNKFNKLIINYAPIKIELLNSMEIEFKKNDSTIAYEKLSSGERKITFLFLSIILNNVDVYLIDEPELSLSLNYQNRIITDLHKLTKNKSLIIATHAPYIYEDFIAINKNLSIEVG